MLQRHQLLSAASLVGRTVTKKNALDEGQKNHLRDIWDAISEYFLLEGDAIRSLIFDKSDGGARWRRLEQFVDMSKEEFDAWFGSRFG